MRAGLLEMAKFACETMAGQLRGTEFLDTPVYWVNVWNCKTDTDFQAHKEFWNWYINLPTALVYEGDNTPLPRHTFTDDDMQPVDMDDDNERAKVSPAQTPAFEEISIINPRRQICRRGFFISGEVDKPF
jgi:hypothetical protein